jgi:hypothetical protein
MGVRGTPDTIDSIEKKRLQWYGHIKRMLKDRIPKLIMEWIPVERKKRGRPRKTWIEGVKAAMTTGNLQPDQWKNREEWRLVCGRRRQLLQNWMNGWMDGWMDGRMDGWRDGWTDGWKAGRRAGRRDGRLHGWI